MRFIAVSKTAAESIASDRFLQSSDFDQGGSLAKLLTTGVGQPPDMPHVVASADGEGLCLVARRRDSTDALVFDMERCQLFQNLSPPDALLVFQRILRFALRYWSRQKLNANEHIVRGTSRAVVFPFPISTRTSFRVSIECSPDAKRMTKRPTAGRCLLVFQAGVDDRPPTGDVPVTVFRKALAALETTRASVGTQREAADPDIPSVGLTRLSRLPSLLDGHIGFDVWDRNLTSTQRAFVHASLVAPHRIEGPAGSGKTICLVLKAISGLRAASEGAADHRVLFVAHSDSTHRAVRGLFDANDPHSFATRDPYASAQSLTVTTLHALCGKLLAREIADSEFLDRDALESKNAQLLYVEQSLQQTLLGDLATHAPFLSHEFHAFLTQEDPWTIALMLQHEISVVIKGRADEQFEKYRRVPRTPRGIPLQSEADRGLVFLIFTRYQEQLRSAAAFDTDDVVLSALGQLNTPIWRRRRAREGYDAIFVDETHLLNLNELSIFHHLTRTDNAFPIAYSADPSQALEDRGWTDELFEQALAAPAEGGTSTTRVTSVFRCSADIVNLAACVASAGATLFANFDESLRSAKSVFTEADERQCARPLYLSCANDEELVRTAFMRAERMTRELDGGRSQVAIIACDDSLWALLKRFAAEANKPLEIVAHRGDVEAVKRAQRSGRFVLCTPDYVGGLEFGGVILVGVDQGRVPPSEVLANSGSGAFLAYQAHSRLYVAITRARYRVELLGNEQRGASKVLKSAFDSGALDNSDPAT